MEAKSGKVVVLIDDHDAVRKGWTELLEACGYKVGAYSSAEVAIQEVKKNNPFVVICDFNLGVGRMDGIKFFQHMAKVHPDISVILTSATSGVDALAKMVNCPFVFKFNTNKLLEMVRGISE